MVSGKLARFAGPVPLVFTMGTLEAKSEVSRASLKAETYSVSLYNFYKYKLAILRNMQGMYVLYVSICMNFYTVAFVNLIHGGALSGKNMDLRYSIL